MRIPWHLVHDNDERIDDRFACFARKMTLLGSWSRNAHAFSRHHNIRKPFV